MKTCWLLVLIVMLVAQTALGQNWVNERTLPPGGPTAQPAVSFDGQIMIWAFGAGGVYSSTNSGVAWETNFIAGVTNIFALACSSDGSKIAAAADNGIYYSANTGRDWLKTPAPAFKWNSVAMSSDGAKLAAVDLIGSNGIYRSTDSGASWTQVNLGSWRSIASSADGSVLVAAGGESSGRITISTNSGDTWNVIAGQALESAAVSADGTTIIASPRATTPYVMLSTNTGATWTKRSFTGGDIYRVGISADAKTMIAVSSTTFHRLESVVADWQYDFFTGLTSGALSGDGKIMIASHASAIAVRSTGRPIVVRQPTPLTVVARTNVNFTASATGALPITFHWFFNDQELPGTNSLINVTITNSGTLKVTAENSFGSNTAIHTLLTVDPVGARMNIGGLSGIWGFVAAIAPGNADTTAWFEWGLDTNYGDVTIATNFPSASGVRTMYFVPRLELGVYHVRAIASNSFGKVITPDARFVPSPITAGMDYGTNIFGPNVSYAWFERGYVTTNRQLGLPPPGTLITSESSPTTTFQFPPDYSAPNALLVDPTGRGTLTLATPAAYSKLAFLTSSGNGSVTVRYQLRFTDDSTETGTFISEDWFNSASPAFIAGARVLPAPSTPLAFPTLLWTIDVATTNPRLNARVVTLTNTTTPIREIELSYVSGIGHAAIFAVSGATTASFTPIGVTGFTQDMIVEAAFSGEPQIFPASVATGNAGILRALPGVRYETWAADSVEGANWTLLTNITALTKSDLPFGPIDTTVPIRIFKLRSR
jgi:hypothetical protein